MNRKTKALTFLGIMVLVCAGVIVVPVLLKNKQPLPEGTVPLDANRVTFRGQTYDIVKINPAKSELRLYWKNEQGAAYGDFESLRLELEKEGKLLRFATNAGIFSEDHTPGGLHIEDGTVLRNLNLRDGAGNFQSPGREEFEYSFDNLASVIGQFVEALGLCRFALYVFDYGAPVGFRLMAAHPERVTAIITQNGNAYLEGLLDSWDPIRAY
ncbi:MAG: alpha/beta fold hydrolase, partial [Bacteroidota bacterium]